MIRIFGLFLVGFASCSDSSPPLVEPHDVGLDSTWEMSVADDVANDVVELDSEPDTPDLDAANLLWRSELYPELWSPGTREEDGRALHDFSYAGYKRGESAFDLPTTQLDIIDFGADPSGQNDSSDAFLLAISTVNEPSVIYIPTGTYRIDRPIVIQTSGVVLLGEGPSSRLWFPNHVDMSYRAHLTFVGAREVLGSFDLNQDASAFDEWVHLDDVSAFTVGERVYLGFTITPEFVAAHHMTDVWGPFNGTDQTFARRTITEIDPVSNRVRLDVPLRADLLLRDHAKLTRVRGELHDISIQNLAFSTAIDSAEAWNTSQIHALFLDRVVDGWVENITTFTPPDSNHTDHLVSGGILIRDSSRVSVLRSHMARPQHIGSGGNGYLFEVRSSNEVLFQDCLAERGRHNFTQNWGFGTSGVVWLRVHSREGRLQNGPNGIFTLGTSDFHHSLATANLIDSSIIDDGWRAHNRKTESSGAGHTSTETVFWNNSGSGRIQSFQFGWGYVIGTSGELKVTHRWPFDPQSAEEEAAIELIGPWTGTHPFDFVEGAGQGGRLYPQSLYEDQLARRIALKESETP